MDPIAALAIVRDPDATLADRVSALDALDTWLTMGGFWLDPDDEHYTSIAHVKGALAAVRFIVSVI